MKKQTTSILLCALLCTTFAHEWLAGQKLVHESRLNHQQKSPSLASSLQTRDSSNSQICEWICEGNVTTTGGLSLIINETAGLVAIVNVTANVAIVISVKENIVGVFNGNTGAVVVIDVGAQVGVYLTLQTSSSLVWVSSKESFEIYFNSLTALKIFINSSSGVHFKISEITTVILEVIAAVLVNFSVEIAAQIKASQKVALELLLSITLSIVTVLRGSLNGILIFAGKGLIALHGDIIWLIAVFGGLGEFFSEIKGGLQALILLKIRLDLALLLGAATGAELFVNLLLAIGAKVDLTVILATIISSPEKFLLLIVKLGGNVSTGVTGFFKIVVGIIAFINGSIKLDIFIKSLLEYAASASGSIDYSVSIQGFLEVIKIQNSTYNNSAGFQVLFVFLEHIQAGTLVIGGVNISTVIAILAKGAANGALVLVVAVLLSLNVAVKAAVVIPQLLLSLLTLLNSTAGIVILEKVVVDVHISTSIKGSSNILAAILSGVNVSQLLLIFDINYVLSHLPVIGVIYQSLSVAVNISSQGSWSLKGLLVSSGGLTIVNQIWVWIKAALNVKVGWGGSGSFQIGR